MVNDLIIYVRRRDSRGRHSVKAQFGKQTHIDKFDVDLNFCRKKFREAVIGKFGLLP